jgi:MFS family permease
MAGTDAVTMGRPTALLPWRQLGLISIYWLGLNAVWGAYEGFGQKQIELLAGRDSVGSVLGPLELLGAMVAILVVPVAGSLSDYTTSRFGKRKGYIIAGATFDLVFIGGLALLARAQPQDWDGAALGSAQLLVAYALLFLGLQLSSNIAQGPYQGLVPDLVAEPQVGLASGLVGIMRTVGVVAGFVIMALGAANELWGPALLLIGILELSLAALTFVFVDDGPPALPRQGRSWTSIAFATWGLDLLRERSFLRMTLVRLLFLMGTGTFINISLLYVERVFAVTDPEERTFLWLAAAGAGLTGTILAALPAARISDRIGRKPVAWAAALLAGCGIAVLALAASPAMALVGAGLLGAGSGAYLAVDWALMTDIIPLASAGRYMGIANIANSISGPLGLAIAGPLMDAFYRAGDVPTGPRVAVGIGVFALAAASVVLLGVHPRRDPRHPGEAESGEEPAVSSGAG